MSFEVAYKFTAKNLDVYEHADGKFKFHFVESWSKDDRQKKLSLSRVYVGKRLLWTWKNNNMGSHRVDLMKVNGKFVIFFTKNDRVFAAIQANQLFLISWSATGYSFSAMPPKHMKKIFRPTISDVIDLKRIVSKAQNLEVVWNSAERFYLTKMAKMKAAEEQRAIDILQKEIHWPKRNVESGVLKLQKKYGCNQHPSTVAA